MHKLAIVLALLAVGINCDINGNYLIQTMLTGNRFAVVHPDRVGSERTNRPIQVGSRMRIFGTEQIDSQKLEHTTWKVISVGHDNLFRMECSDAPDFCLSTNGTSSYEVTSMQQCTDENAQLTWHHDTKQITNPLGFCLQTRSGDNDDWTSLIWRRCTGATSEQWIFRAHVEGQTGSAQVGDEFHMNQQLEAEAARVAAEAAEAERARVQAQHDTAMRAWEQQIDTLLHEAVTNFNHERSTAHAGFENASNCGTVSEDGQCGAHAGRCPWQNCSARGWCGTGQYFTGNPQYNHIAGCRTLTDIRVHQNEWDRQHPNAPTRASIVAAHPAPASPQ